MSAVNRRKRPSRAERRREVRLFNAVMFLAAFLFFLPLVFAVTEVVDVYRLVTKGELVTGKVSEFICPRPGRRMSGNGYSASPCDVVISNIAPQGIAESLRLKREDPTPWLRTGDTVSVLVLASTDGLTPPKARLDRFWSLWEHALVLGMFGLAFAAGGGVVLFFAVEAAFARPKKRKPKVPPSSS